MIIVMFFILLLTGRCSLRKLGVDRAKLVSRLLFVDSVAYPSRRAEVDSVCVVALFLLQLRFPHRQRRGRDSMGIGNPRLAAGH